MRAAIARRAAARARAVGGGAGLRRARRARCSPSCSARWSTPARFTRALRGVGRRAPPTPTSSRRCTRPTAGGWRRSGAPTATATAWAALDALRADPARWGGRPVFLYGFDDLTPRAARRGRDARRGCAEAEVCVALPYEPGRARARRQRGDGAGAARRWRASVVALRRARRALRRRPRGRRCTTSSAGCSRPARERRAAERRGAAARGGRRARRGRARRRRGARADARRRGAGGHRGAGARRRSAARCSRRCSRPTAIPVARDAPRAARAHPARRRRARVRPRGAARRRARATSLAWLRTPGQAARRAGAGRRARGARAPRARSVRRREARALWERARWALPRARRARRRGRGRAPAALLAALLAEAEAIWTAPHRRRADVLDARGARRRARGRRACAPRAGELRALADADPALLGGAGGAARGARPRSRCAQGGGARAACCSPTRWRSARGASARCSCAACRTASSRAARCPSRSSTTTRGARWRAPPGCVLPRHEDVLDARALPVLRLRLAARGGAVPVLALVRRGGRPAGSRRRSSTTCARCSPTSCGSSAGGGCWPRSPGRRARRRRRTSCAAPRPRRATEPEPAAARARPATRAGAGALAARATASRRAGWRRSPPAACAGWSSALLQPGAGRARPRADAPRLARPRGARARRCARLRRAHRLGARSTPDSLAGRARGAATRRSASSRATARGARGAGRALRALEADLERYLRHEAEHGAGLEPTQLEWSFGREGDEHGPLALGAALAVTRPRRPRRRRPGGARDRARLQGPHRPRRRALGARTAALQVALYVLAVRELLGLEPVGGALPAARRRATRARAGSSATTSPGRYVERRRRSTARRSRRALERARASAAAAAARRCARAGSAPCPERCSPHGCALPGDLPARADEAAAATAAGARRASRAEQRAAIDDRAGSRAARRQRRLRQDRGDGRALRRGGAATTASPVGAILALTFTEKAAGELRERIRRRFAELGEDEHARAVDGAWIGTIHGFCARVLRAQPLAAGLDPRFDGARRGAPRGGSPRAPTSARSRPGRAARGRAGGRPRRRLRRRACASIVARRARDAAHAAAQTQPRLADPAAPRRAPDPARAARPPRAAARRATLATARRAACGVERGARARSRRCERLLARRRRAACPADARRRRAQERRARRSTRTPCEAYRDGLDRATAQRCADHHARAALVAARRAARPLRRARTRRPRPRARGGRLRGPRAAASATCSPTDAALRARWAERFALIMVDEFQDTNRAPARHARGARARQPVRGRRRVPVDLRLPPRRRDDLPRAPGRARRARACAACAVNFRSRAELLDVAQRRVRARARRALRAARRRPRGAPSDATARCGCSTPTPPPATPPRRAAGHRHRAAGTSARRARARRRSRPAAVAPRRGARCSPHRLREEVDARPPRRATSSCSCARPRRCGCSSRRSRSRACRPTSSAAAATGPRSRSATASPTSRVLANPLDEEALLRRARLAVLRRRAPTRWCCSPQAGREARRRVGRAARGRRRAPWLGALPADERERLRALRALLRRRARAGASGSPVEVLLERAIAAHRLRPRGARPRRRRAAAGEPAQADAAGARVRARRGPRPARLPRLRRRRRTSREAREGEAALESEGLDAVRLMTIHRAKGLEFPVVCVADLGRPARRPRARLLLGARRRASGSGSRRSAAATPCRRSATSGSPPSAAAAEAEEERRLFYVAMTRAARAADPVRRHRPRALARAARRAAPPIDWIAPALLGDPRGARRRPSACVDAPWDGRAGARARARRLRHARPRCRRGRAAPAPPRRAPARPAPRCPRAPKVVPRAARAAAPAPQRLSLLRAAGRTRAAATASTCSACSACRASTPPPPDAASAGREAAQPGLDPRMRGSIVHALLEELDFARPAAARRRRGRSRSAAAHGVELDRRGGRGHPRARRRVRRLAAVRAPRRRAATSAARRRSRSRSSRTAAARSSRLRRRARPRAGRRARWSSTTRPTGSTAPSRPSSSSATTRPSASSTRSPRCATARRAVEVAYCFLERPGEPVTAHASRSRRRARARRARSLSLARGVLDERLSGHRRRRTASCAATARAARALCSWPEAMTLRDAPPRPTTSAGSFGRQRRAVVASRGRLRRAPQVDDRVELGAEQQHEVRQPQPDEQDHGAGERAVGRRVGREVRDVEEERGRGDDPRHDAEHRARA